MTPKEKKTKVAAFSYCVTALGFTQKEAARQAGISEKLAGKWVKEYNLKAKMNKLQKAMKDKPLKFDDSLSAFKAYVRIKHPDLHNNLEAVYNKYLNTL